MHYNKQRNDLIQNEINDNGAINYTPTTEENKTHTEINSGNETIPLSFKENTKNRKQHDASDSEIHTGTTTSCTSSTDSGVNISDNDETSSSPTSSHLKLALSATSSLHTNNKYNENRNQDNNINNNKGNNYNNYIFNSDNGNYNDDHYDDKDNKDNNSKNSDNKLKTEQYRKRQQLQQFLKVENSSNESKNTRYKTDQNIIESENVINFSPQRNSASQTITSTTAATTNNDQSSLQHNEFNINSSQRSVSTSSSLSISSATNSCANNPPSQMHHQYSGSPVVSIRSISSTIITSDSDSDLSDDAEGVHENYVIKKLGTQVTFPPKHPDIPNINSGHTVLNQKVIPNGDQTLASPLAALAAIGDNIGAAQALGPVPSFSAVPQRPQIGSIALSNSSDVTFGDKHFYEGPVTIQQFLIDGRDKWRETNEKENPTFVDCHADTANNAKDINSSAEHSSKLLKRKKLIIPGVLVLLALVIMAAVLGSKALNDSKSKIVIGNSEETRSNVPINSTIDTNDNHANHDDECPGNGTLCLMGRDDWRAHQPTGKLDTQVLPLHRAIISHTASEPCNDVKSCAERVRVIQEFHMNSIGWDDIGYNFLISSDGRVYVGRGWDAVGAHTKGYNYDSVGISFIGTYMKIPPSEAQLNACLALLEEGVRLKKLVPNYRLYGARQFAATESPGDMLYRKIKTWEHWSADINLTK